MARYQVILAYDGTDFQGFQRQANARTVQGVVETALTPAKLAGTGDPLGRAHRYRCARRRTGDRVRSGLAAYPGGIGPGAQREFASRCGSQNGAGSRPYFSSSLRCERANLPVPAFSARPIVTLCATALHGGCGQKSIWPSSSRRRGSCPACMTLQPSVPHPNPEAAPCANVYWTKWEPQAGGLLFEVAANGFSVPYGTPDGVLTGTGWPKPAGAGTIGSGSGSGSTAAPWPGPGAWVSFERSVVRRELRGRPSARIGYLNLKID